MQNNFNRENYEIDNKEKSFKKEITMVNFPEIVVAAVVAAAATAAPFFPNLNSSFVD